MICKFFQYKLRLADKISRELGTIYSTIYSDVQTTVLQRVFKIYD